MFETSEVLQEQLNPLLDALHHNDLEEIEKWMTGNDWQLLLQLLQIDCSYFFFF